MSIKTIYGKKPVAQFSKTLDNEDFTVVILDDGNTGEEAYWDVHLLSEKYVTEELNTLKLQEPKDVVKVEDFTTEKMIGILMEHFIWDRFYELGVISASVEIENIEPHESGE